MVNHLPVVYMYMHVHMYNKQILERTTHLQNAIIRIVLEPWNWHCISVPTSCELIIEYSTEFGLARSSDDHQGIM
jgi:hypothetical protein